jgi:hypothetical protein
LGVSQKKPELKKKKSLKVNWKENLIDAVLKELEQYSITDFYNAYGQRIPMRTLRYWFTNRAVKKKHKRKGRKTQLKVLEHLLFEWFLFQRGHGNVLTDKVMIAKAERLKAKILVYKFLIIIIF